MRSELVFLSLSLLVIQTLSMSTTTHKPSHKPHIHKTHPTVERPVTDLFNFKYDPKSHLMVAMTNHKCYVYSMTATETVDVHTSHGIHALETKLITMVDDTTKTYQMMTMDRLNATSLYLARTCSHKGWTIYKLN